MDGYGRSGGFTTYDDEQLAGQLGRWISEGHDAVKMKVGGPHVASWANDVRRVFVAREAIGADAQLFVDANGTYSAAEALRFADAIADAHVTWFEEPVSADDLSGLSEMRSRVTIDVAANEYGFDAWYFQRMCSAGAVDCLQIDVTRCGGYTGWFVAAAIAWSHCLDVSAHCAPYLHAPVAAVTERLCHVEWFHDHVRIELAESRLAELADSTR